MNYNEVIKKHHYTVQVTWTGNSGEGTRSYDSYERDHVITVNGKPTISGSSDPAFRGDKTRYNPEELLVASLSSCHMLWFLHLASLQGIVVVDYADNPRGTMDESSDGGKFVAVTLRPVVTVKHAVALDKIEAIHASAHSHCFIANSVNFPVTRNTVLRIAEGAG